MRKRLPIVAAALFVLSVLLIASQVLRPREPLHEGKSLSAWLADLDLGSRGSPDIAVNASQAVRAVGTNSFPWLIKMLRATDPLWRQALLAINARQSVVRFPLTPASVVRARAIHGYAALGAAARDSVPELIRLMESESSPQVRCCVAAALGRIGREARPAIPILLKAADDPNPEVSKNALSALANIQMWAPDNSSR